MATTNPNTAAPIPYTSGTTPQTTGSVPSTAVNDNTNFMPVNNDNGRLYGTYNGGPVAGNNMSGGSSFFGGASTSGMQPGGNNYPAGIYGPGANGSGTALGTLTSNELTSNDLTGLLDSNSPYIQQARQQATNAANSRGSLNSSIAAGNAQGAAIQAGLPIAQADATAAQNLQATNLNNLSKTQTANIGANATMTAAGMAAGASMYDTRENNEGALLRQTDQNAFQGEQNELAFENSYKQNMDLDQFNLGASLLTGQQSFYNQAGIAAMQDPAIMGDPTAFGGYLQFLSNPFSNSINNIFSSIFGSNTPAPVSP